MPKLAARVGRPDYESDFAAHRVSENDTGQQQPNQHQTEDLELLNSETLEL
jgi:hypothetical protein